MNLIFSFLITLVILFIIPVLVYGAFAAFAGLKEPEKKLSFFVSVLVQKIGTAFGFVALFALGSDYFASNWLVYGAVWAAMFTIVEIGQSIGPDYSKKEALAGIISEFIYFPLAALVLAKFLG